MLNRNFNENIYFEIDQKNINYRAKTETNDTSTCKVEKSIFMQEIKIGSDESTDSWDAVGSTNVVDGSCTFWPIDEKNLEFSIK